MTGFLFIACILAIILALLGVYTAAYRRRGSKARQQPVTACRGMVLNRWTPPLSLLKSAPTLRARVRTEQGEVLELELKSLPLYEALPVGVPGTAQICAGVLQDFVPDGGDEGKTEEQKETIEEAGKMSRQMLLKNGTLWGAGQQDVLIQDGKILAVGTNFAVGEDTQTVDLTGYTVLPGFFNAHVHTYGVRGPLSDELMRRFVTGGVTTVRDMGMTSTLPWEEYMSWLDQHRGLEYPDIIPSGKFICGENTYGAVHPSGAKIGYVIEETPEAAARAVDAMVDGGAKLVKTGLDYGMDPEHPLDYLPEEVFRAICEQAKKRGVPSAAHITKADNFVKAAEWGLTECAHTSTNHLSDEDIAAAAESGMAVNTTLSIFDMVSAETGEKIMDDVIDNIGRIYRAGVPVSVGTDFMFENPPYQTPGIPIHELRLLHRAGLSVEEVIRAATIDTARICGVGDETGSIEPGKYADIIAVSGQIDESFAALEQVSFVLHRGQVIVPLEGEK